MTIHDLAAQYRADGKARVFVEAVWVAISEERTENLWSVFIRPALVSKDPSLFNSGWHHREATAWAAAADFTLQRIEEIRLSEEDTLLIFTKMAACYLRRKESYQRILFREHAHLDSLTKGMKPEVLE